MPGIFELWPANIEITHVTGAGGTMTAQLIARCRVFIRADGVAYVIDQTGEVRLRLTDLVLDLPHGFAGTIDGIDGQWVVQWSPYTGCNCGTGEALSRDTAMILAGCPADDPCTG